MNNEGMYNHLDNVVNVTWNYAGKLKDKRDEVLNAVLGLAGEAGEVADLHKKMLFHADREGQREELKLELGDVAYYWLKLIDLYGFTIEEVLAGNFDKLYDRHPEMWQQKGIEHI